MLNRILNLVLLAAVVLIQSTVAEAGHVDGMSLYRAYFTPKDTDPSGLETLDCPLDCDPWKRSCEFDISLAGDVDKADSVKLTLGSSPCFIPSFHPDHAWLEPMPDDWPCEIERARTCFGDLDRDMQREPGYIQIWTLEGEFCRITRDNFPPDEFGLNDDSLSEGCKGLVESSRLASTTKVGEHDVPSYCGVVYKIKKPIKKIEVKFKLDVLCGCSLGGEIGDPPRMKLANRKTIEFSGKLP